MRSPGSARRVPLTALYAPGDRPDRFERAVSSGADIVIVDLEDGVAATVKDAARAEVDGWLAGRRAAGGWPEIQVRVNALNTPWAAADLEMLAGHGGAIGVRLPMVGSTHDVEQARRRLGPDIPLHVVVETTLGVEAAYAIASTASVASIGLGEADLASELGVADDSGLAWSRGRIVVAARAAGLPAPMMSVYTQLSDEAGLRASCRLGRALGFVGRSAVHPAQLRPIVEEFRPSATELAQAQATVAELAEAAAHGAGVRVLPDGEMVDAAMLGRAQAVLSREAGAAAALDSMPGR